MQLLQADRVTEPYTSKLEKNEQGFNDVASLIGSLIADFAKESQEAKEITRRLCRSPPRAALKGYERLVLVGFDHGRVAASSSS